MKKLFFILLLAVSCGRVIKVENPLDVDRNGEMVSIDAPEGVYRLLSQDGKEVPYQITYDGKLIFQANVPALGKVSYRLVKGNPAPADTIACGSLRPDRRDDIIWENEHSGWRIYGPGTHSANAQTYGYDIFTKSVPYPVMAKRFDLNCNEAIRDMAKRWRKEGLQAKADSLLQAISFHVDHGDGMDVYTVGSTLGCGTAALLADDGSIIYPWCWESYQILDNGPLRFTLRVVMDGGKETRLITCDAGSWLNKVEIFFEGLEEASIVPGIVIHESNPDAYASGEGWIAYADLGDPNPGENGEIYCGVVSGQDSAASLDQGHILLHDTYSPGYTYWFGSSWSKGETQSLQAWCETLALCREKLLHPLEVK